MIKEMKNILKTIIRLAITGIVLFLVFRKVNFIDILELLKGVNIGIFLLSFVAYGIMVLLCAIRWRELLKVQQIDIPYSHTLTYYLIGFFYNNILPTVVGGGVVRALYVGRAKQKNKEAFSSMLVEIVIGGWALIMFALITLFFWFKSFSLYHLILPLFGIFIFSTLLLCLFFERGFMRKIKLLTDKIKLFGLNTKLKGLYEALYLYKDKKLQIIEAVLLSFGIQTIIALMNFLIGLSLGFRLPLMSYIVYPVIIGLITAIPITINGLGIREWAYRIFFAQVGLNPSQAVTFSMLFYFVGVIGSLLGGIVFLFVKFPEVKNKV